MTTPQDVIRAYLYKRGFALSSTRPGTVLLAKKTNINYATIWRYMRAGQGVTDRTLERIAKALSMDAGRLILLDRICRGAAPKELFGEAMEFFEKDLNGYADIAEEHKE